MMGNDKIIITGATGMIGTAVIREYLKHDTKAIYAVVRPGSKNISRIPKDERIRIVECEISDYSSLKNRICEQCDVFFHFAWDGTGANKGKSTKGQALNIVYTLDALNAAHELCCGKFIGSGSQAEYGILDLESINEESPARPVIPYGIAKLAAGQLALAEAKKLGMDCFWVRIFSAYGLYDKPTTMISNAIARFRAGEKMSFTPAEQRWDYLHCDDAARAFYAIAEKSEGQKLYCLGSGQPHRLKEFIYAMRDIIDPDAEPGIGEIPYKGNEVMNLCADITRIRTDTGWEPVISFAEGIRMILEEPGQ